MATLARAIAIAATAHQDQKDRAGAPYVLHPLRMLLSLETELERIVAVLHDLVEDTDWTFDRLRAEGFGEEVLQALDCVTRRQEESYEEFILRSLANPVARRVKLADLEDNMDLTRMEAVLPRDLERVERYHRAWLLLRNVD